MGGQRHAPVALPPGKTRYPLYRRLGGPQGRSGQVQRISLPTGIRFPHRPVRSRYTDWALFGCDLFSYGLIFLSFWICVLIILARESLFRLFYFPGFLFVCCYCCYCYVVLYYLGPHATSQDRQYFFFYSHQKQEIFSSPKCSGWIWGPHGLLSS